MNERKPVPMGWEGFHNEEFGSTSAVILENDSCRVTKVTGETGEGVMTMYQVFDGVYLMYHDFHMRECVAEFAPEEALLCIAHCREGRIEMSSENGTSYYMEKGDMRIDNMTNHRGACRFPLCHYHGITIGFMADRAEAALRKEMPSFEFDIKELTAKFCSDDTPFVIRNEPSVEHLFYQLYKLPGRVQKDYFKIKIMELLLYLSGMEVDPYKVERPYFYASQVEKIRAIERLITSDLTHSHTLEELSDRFSISLTTMKRCFKSTYGSPIYSYLKKYRIHQAANLLITRRELKTSVIGAMVGYESPSKFTAVFHEMMGETPLGYRKNHGLEI